MKRTLLLLSLLLPALFISAQTFYKDDVVEVDPTLSDTLASKWKKATVLHYDTATHKYTVAILDGDKITIPSQYPEKWMRPVVDNKVVNKYGPGARIPYERREAAIRGYRCNPSENGVKKNIKSMMAAHFKDYPYISVDFTSFKGQNGHDDKKFNGQFVYPYKIEMLVHLKRTLVMGGRMYTEYQTWEFDREYEYATRPGKNCEFYAVPSSDAELISRRWYY